MMKNAFMKKVVFSLAMAAMLVPVVPASKVNAAAKTVETRYIRGDGARLRKEGWDGGAVLELMYNGEKINYYPDVYGSDPEYNYMRRVKTGTYGYVNHDYTRSY